jgi:hypothetical protein
MLQLENIFLVKIKWIRFQIFSFLLSAIVGIESWPGLITKCSKESVLLITEWPYRVTFDSA